MLLTDILTERFTDTLVQHFPFFGRDLYFYMPLFYIRNIVIDFLEDPAVLDQVLDPVLNQALIVASSFGCDRDVVLFLKLCADVNATNEYGDNALEGALVDEKLEIVKLLVEAGSKLSEDYYEAAEYYGEEYTKPLRIAYERTLNEN